MRNLQIFLYDIGAKNVAVEFDQREPSLAKI